MTDPGSRPPESKDLPGTPAPHDQTRVVRYIVTAAMGLFLVVCVVQRLSLFADGAYGFLVTLLEPGLNGLHPRVVSETVLRLPLLIAIRLGARDVELLQLAYGMGMYLHFVAMVLVCALASRRARTLMLYPAASFFLLSANMAFWPFSGSHVAVSVFWALLFALTLPDPWSRGWRAGCLVLALMATAAFESMLFLGPVLAAVGGWRYLRETSSEARRIASAIVALCLTAVLVSLAGIEAKGADHFTKSAFALRDGSGRFHGMMILSLGALPLVVTAGTRHTRLWRAAATVLSVGCAAWVGLTFWMPESVLTVSVHHDVRTFNLWVTVALSAAFLVHRHRGGWRDVTAWQRAWRLVAFVGLAQTAWVVAASVHWDNYLRLVGSEVRNGRGIVPYESTQLNNVTVGRSVTRRFTWGWTLPILSVLQAPEGRVRSIIDNPAWYDGDFEAFDPTNLRPLLPLGRYGIDVSGMTDR